MAYWKLATIEKKKKKKKPPPILTHTNLNPLICFWEPLLSTYQTPVLFKISLLTLTKEDEGWPHDIFYHKKNGQNSSNFLKIIR
jgi:hypothetical protein